MTQGDRYLRGLGLSLLAHGTLLGLAVFLWLRPVPEPETETIHWDVDLFGESEPPPAPPPTWEAPLPEVEEPAPTEPTADLDPAPPTDTPSAPPLFGMPSIAVPGTVSSGTTAIPETNLLGSTLGAPSLGSSAPGGRLGQSDMNVGLMPTVRMQPEYPLEARRQKIEGWVKVEMTVLENGSVTDIKIRDEKPQGVFDQAVLKAVAQWRFRPATVDGKPARGRATQTLRFNLNN